MADITKKPDLDEDRHNMDRPPAAPGPRNGQGHPPSSIGEGNTSGGQAGVDANDPDEKPTP